MEQNNRPWRSLASVMSVGFVLVVCIVMGYFAGTWAGRRLDIGPWGTVIGVVLGAAAGFVQVFRVARREMK